MTCSQPYSWFVTSVDREDSGVRLFVVCGLPGAGKTTLALKIEESVGALRLCPDEWMMSLGIDLFDGVARDRVERL